MNEMMPLRSDLAAFEHAPVRLTVDLGAVVENWRMLCKLSARARTAAVVKADAYGLGAAEVGQALAAAGCQDFFVATPDEGARLRNALPDARIFILTGIWPGMEERIFANRLIPVIGSLEQLAYFRSCGQSAAYALYVDTGMNRLGLTVAEAASLSHEPRKQPVLVLSHLACPDDPHHPMNHRQLESFQTVSQLFKGVESSLSSSAGIFLGPDYHFNLNRPGIALYGGEAVTGVPNPMRPTATAEARILQIRDVRKGDAASYGATHRFDRDSRVAIVGAGYADGWRRSMSGSGVTARQDGSAGAFGFLGGARVPIVGRITMDLTMFDIGDVPENRVRTGDYVELFGPNIRLDDAARAAGTIGYELLTGLGARHVRRYI
ncbi:MAG: alr [Rhizobium sp.]|nr:alr [Rhizobium sp.]